MGLFEIFKKKSESEVKPTCDDLYPHEVLHSPKYQEKLRNARLCNNDKSASYLLRHDINRLSKKPLKPTFFGTQTSSSTPLCTPNF